MAMTKPMTLEELKEKARLTDEEMVKALEDAHLSPFANPYQERCVTTKAQQDKDFNAFLKWCEREHIYQVVEGELPNEDSIAGSIEEESAYEEAQQDMLKAGYKKVKPVSEVLNEN